MSISPQLHIREEFFRFLEAPTRENFRELLRGHLGEFDFLDFKENWPEKSKLAKHIGRRSQIDQLGGPSVRQFCR